MGSLNTTTQLVTITIQDNGVAILALNRPQKKNALSQALIDSLCLCLQSVERNEQIRAVVLTGSNGSPFSAGADLSELALLSTAEAQKIEYLKDLADAVAALRKPIIAAVVGFALGGGFELAMMCDIIYSGTTTRFGLPELSVGTIPGAGGTQRLTRALGKFKAMEMILTTAVISGEELHRLGLVSQSFAEDDEVLPAVLACAGKIAERSAPVVRLAKQAVLNAEQTDLDSGIKLERSLYYGSFSLQDCSEGMSAFLEKRVPVWGHH